MKSARKKPSGPVTNRQGTKTTSGKRLLQKFENIEQTCAYRITEDVNRIKGAVDPKLLPFVLESLNLKDPTSEVTFPAEETSSLSVAEEPVVHVHEEKRSTSLETGPKEVTRKESTEEEEQEFRQSVMATIYKRIATKPVHSPYKLEPSSSEEEEEAEGEARKTGEPRGESKRSTLSSYLSTEAGCSLKKLLSASRHDPPPDVLSDNRSPYQKFFSRPKTEIKEFLERHTKQQPHSEKDKLFVEFINFLDLPDIKLKSENINLDSLKALFDIQIKNPAAQAFAADIIELPKIPKEISEIYDDVQASSRACLHRQIIWDMMYERGAERKLAFGRCHPRQRPLWKRDTRRNWLVSEEVPWDLVSGRQLWKDLINTEILEGFSKWLVANPQYDRPKYLEKIGYFDNIVKETGQGEDPVSASLKKKRCGEAFYSLANNMKYFVGDKELSYLPRLEELAQALEDSTQPPGSLSAS